MTITIDCRMLNASGVGVYLRECLPWFLESENTFLLLGDAGKLAYIAESRKNTEILNCDIRTFSVRELFAFPRKIIKKINSTSLFYSPYFNIPGGITIPVYTTIHDIIFPDMPELTSKIGLALRMWFYRRTFRYSKKLFTVSNFSKSRIEHFLGNSTPVIVTYNAAQSYLSNQEHFPVEKQNFILFIGNIKKHKGLWCLLDAFFQAKKEGLPYKLVIVGSKEHFRSVDDKVANLLGALDPAIVEFTGFIPNEQVKELLISAALLVQPSLYEGFGYPPLEAMTAGTKALISDIPVFKEIYAGFPVTFFRAGDSDDLKEKLLALLHNKKPETITLSRDLAEKYSFKKTAEIIIKELEKP